MAVWRWRNVPIPEPHVGGLCAGLVAHAFAGWHVFASSLLGHAIGWPLLGLGSAVVVWSVVAASDADLREPGSVIIGGPYRLSRNPMYVGWTIVYVGVALVVNTAWPLALLPLVLVSIHWTVIREERSLGRRLGAEYATYMARTRRYL